MRNVGRVNRARVAEFFRQFPTGSNRDCAAMLGLSAMAVGRHARALREDAAEAEASEPARAALLAALCDGDAGMTADRASRVADAVEALIVDQIRVALR